ncbi:MAG: signal peptidase II [Candidatus Omnitrophica bacterium]|nr:signal peptidase II [Candidatus Omnitrophota bacterium]
MDQLSKYLALHFLPPEDTIPVIAGIFHLTLVKNTGIAFGLFGRYDALLNILIPVSILILSFVGFRACLQATKTQPQVLSMTMPYWALGLILGGAIGNWIDRVRFGAVIDFLDFRVWPVFNVADSAITIGVGFYFILLLRARE